MIGALDDCLVEKEKFMSFDYKSKGFRPKTSGVEYYQTQLDCYELMLSTNGFKTCGRGFLAYFWPEVIWDLAKPDIKIVGDWGVEVFEIACDADRARALIEKAVKLIAGERPDSDTNCEYCNFARNWAESNG